MRPQFQTGNVTWGGAEPVFILGPCVIESEEFVWRMARAIHGICREVGAQFIFKASYDKANRSSIGSYRGPGIKKGLALMAKIRKKLNVKSYQNTGFYSRVRHFLIQ